MGRKARFTEEQFIGAALELLAECGPAGVTMNALARKIGAPVGSVYHRFPSRDVLLAELWVRIAESFQDGFVRVLARDDGLAAALHTPRWVRKHPKEGRVLLLYRREEITAGDWPDSIKERAAYLTNELNEEIRAFVRRRCGCVTKKNLTRTVFALIDVPAAAVRRYLDAGETPPDSSDDLVRETYHAICGGTK